MITERDLMEAIAECQGERNPNANTCIKLAAYYTIQREMFGNSERLAASDPGCADRAYSFAEGPISPAEEIVQYTSGTEFGSAIDGQKAAKIWPIMDELMSIVQTLYPDIYKRTMELVK